MKGWTVLKEDSTVTGSLYEKHNYWVMVLYGLSAALYPEKNITDLSQKKKRWISTSLPSTAKNKRTAEKMLYDNLKKYELEENRILADPDSYSSQPNYASGGQVLFTDYLTDWLERKKNKIQLITWEGYEVYARRHIIPYFNELNLTLAELKPRHFADYYEYKFSGGRLDRKKGGLGNRSLRSHAQLIKAVLNEAVIYEYILRNPAEKVPIPRKPKTESDSTKNVYMTAEEANDMLHKLRGEWIQPIVFIALLYGLRKSEVLGIKWSAVDFEKNTIEINHTVVKHKSIVYQDSTKTENSRNTFELLPEARELLLDIHARQERNREICGNGYYESDYVFTWDDGHLFRPDAITVSFQRALKRHGLPEMRFHDLRHPYVKHTTKIFSLRSMAFQAQAYPDARRKTRGACQLHQGGQSRIPVRPLCNRKRFSYLPPQSKMSWILYAISMRLSGYTSTRSINSSASSVVSVSASKIALDAFLRLSCRACSSCFCFACANTAA